MSESHGSIGAESDSMVHADILELSDEVMHFINQRLNSDVLDAFHNGRDVTELLAVQRSFLANLRRHCTSEVVQMDKLSH